MKLNWKLATDTFGETYHFKRLQKDTLAKNAMAMSSRIASYGVQSANQSAKPCGDMCRASDN